MPQCDDSIIDASLCPLEYSGTILNSLEVPSKAYLKIRPPCFVDLQVPAKIKFVVVLKTRLIWLLTIRNSLQFLAICKQFINQKPSV